MGSKRRLTIALVALVVVTVAGSVAHARHRTRVSNSAFRTLADDSADLVLPGVLSPAETTPIEAPVWNLTVPMNSYVTKGQIIGETASTMLPNQTMRRSESRLSRYETEAAIAQVRENVRQAEADLEAARARETDAAVQKVVSKVTERATEQLYENAGQRRLDGQMSATRYEHAVKAVDSAAAEADATRSEAEADSLAVSDAMARLQEARASLAEAEQQWQRALPATGRVRESGQMAVVAPANGLLVARDPNSGTLEISSDPSVMRVETRMPADDLFKLRVGEQAWVSLQAKPRVTLRATVSEIAEAPVDSPNGAVYAVSLVVDNPQGLWLAGAKVNVHATGASPETGSK
jgi:hypothetical protein